MSTPDASTTALQDSISNSPGEPNYVGYLRGELKSALIHTHGLTPRWLAPVSIVDAPNGFGAEVWDSGLRSPTISIVLTGGAVTSEVPHFRRKVRGGTDRKITLQVPGQYDRYSAQGPVRCALFHLTDELIAKVVEGWNLSKFDSEALRSDLIMVEDWQL